MSENPLIINSSVSEIAKEAAAMLIASGQIELKKNRKKRVNWERVLAYEYMQKFYPTHPTWFRVNIGPIPEGPNQELYSKVRRWADVVVRMPDHMMIIETKMMAQPQVVGQINNYEYLLPETPMFEKYKNEPVKKRVVCAHADPQTVSYIERNNIEVVIFKPSNYEAWYQQMILKNRGT